MARQSQGKSRGRRKGSTPRSTRREVAEPTLPGRSPIVPAPQYPRRPAWQKLVGWLSIAAGLALIVVNFIDYSDFTILPIFLGLVVGVSGTWWLGLFDRRR